MVSQPETTIELLPNELLVRIFLIGIELDRSSPYARPSLITYCGVSSRWRSIGHHTPQLWTNIRVPFEQAPYPDVITWVTTWFERSKPCLFDLNLELHSPYIDPPQASMVMFNLVPHVPRLRRLLFSVDGHFDEVQDIFRPLCAIAEAPQLIDIQLHFREKRSMVAFMNLPSPTTFRSAPLLQRQSLQGIQIQYPLHGLTELEVNHLIPDELNFRRFAIDSPMLEKLTLTRLHPLRVPADLTQPKSVFPALRSLSLGFIQPTLEPGTSVLALMSPPNLTYLAISNIYTPQAFTSFPDPAILTNLHTLCIDQVVPAQQDIVSFYLGLRSVKHLKFINTPPLPFFPEEQDSAARKPLLRSRSGELRKTNSSGSEFRVAIQEMDHKVLGSNEIIKLPLVPGSSSRSNIPYTHWPNLTTITLDTIRAKDLLWLCQLVALRPEIETVYLSRSAKRHLVSSLMMWKDGSKETFSSWDANLRVRPMKSSRYEVQKGNMEPLEWLQQRVKLLPM